ncbi:DUF4007 family protein [Xanthomonas sacchari]
MATSPLPDSIQFSGHETFPLRQLWLRKAYEAATHSDYADNAKSAFVPENGIRRFGVGKNMVAAIRHWALACDVLEEQYGGKLGVGGVGRALFGSRGLDPYLEKPASAWWVHWLLAGRAMRSTTWWWVFNRITQQTFDAETVADSLTHAAAQGGHRVSRVTLKRDVDVCVRCYVARRDGRAADDAAEPLLADLGLLAEGPTGTFRFRRGPQSSLPDGLFALALLEFWEAKQRADGSGQATLSFETIAHEFGAPGRVFKLDENSVGDRLVGLEDISEGQLRWSDTAGVRQVSLVFKESPDALRQRLLRHAYGK